MRDYNSIPFRNPRTNNSASNSNTTTLKKVTGQQHPLTGSTPPGSPAQQQRGGGGGQQQQQQQLNQLEEEKKDGGSSSFMMNSHPEQYNVGSFSSAATYSTTSTASPSSPLQPQQQQQQPQTYATKYRTSLLEQQQQQQQSTLVTPTSNNNKTAAAAVSAKSDAVILELRSSVRQLKRQLEKVQDEKRVAQEQCQDAVRTLQQVQQQQQPRQQQQEDDESSLFRDARVGELQVQLDRAAAQILTADMVRKELEDTLEAEQYTWELRVQDQERAISQLQLECVTLADELLREKQATQAALQQTHEAEQKAAQAAQQQQQQQQQGDDDHTKSMNNDSLLIIQELQVRIRQLEQERAELQGCLDEALQELEAVDVELQGDHGLRLENERLQLLIQQLQQERERNNDNDDEADINNNTDAVVVGRSIDIDVNAQVLEGLVHLYRWLLERDGVDENNVHALTSSSPNNNTDAMQVLKAITEHLENNNNNNNASGSTTSTMHETKRHVAELETQLLAYRCDLRAREESSVELRTSLKEAVALLKPLQDAVGKADLEKHALIQQIQALKKAATANATQRSANISNNYDYEEMRRLKDKVESKEDEIQRLQQKVETLEIELSRAKVTAATSLISAHNNRSIEMETASAASAPDSLSKGLREELKAKRAAELTLQHLLRETQSRFHELHSQNAQVSNRNDELQGRLRQAEQKLEESGETTSSTISVASFSASTTNNNNDNMDSLQRQLALRATKITDLENELMVLRGDLAEKNVELREMGFQLREAQQGAAKSVGVDQNYTNSRAWHVQQAKLKEIEAKYNANREMMGKSKSAEKALKKSLKEALGLLKPLQMHLEEAEKEKRELAAEIRELRRKFGQQQDQETVNNSNNNKRSAHKVASDAAAIRELEETVKHLENENSQLHDALEDMSQSINVSHLSGVSNNTTSQKNDSRLREEIVELQSRTEVMHSRLQVAYAENHSLVESINKREKEERGFLDEIYTLREKLKKSECELDNAKFIATTALVKVEELTMDHVTMNKSSHFDQEAMFQQKARELDREIHTVGQGATTSVQYRLT